MEPGSHWVVEEHDRTQSIFRLHVGLFPGVHTADPLRAASSNGGSSSAVCDEPKCFVIVCAAYSEGGRIGSSQWGV